MSLPRFLDRVVDSTAPLLGGLDREAVREKLAEASVTLAAGDRVGDGVARDGFLFAANLAARLYPRIRLHGPEELVAAADREITLINPIADVTADDKPTVATLEFEVDDARADRAGVVSVSARGWNVYIDDVPGVDDAPAAPAALAAAAIGAGELFRIVFADDLGERGRRGPQPGSFNLVTLGSPSSVAVPSSPDLGSFRLVGAGAIGQAAAEAIAAAGARGRLQVIDPDRVALSNLQRYVLTRDGDVGSVKVELLHDRLAKSGLEIVSTEGEWHAGLVDAQLPTLVALDSAEARIGVQASLPGPIYNAWTQPADVGWSRHERFGDDPCLACLYWPERERPSRHEQIAAAFHLHPLRVLAYLVHRSIPIGRPLPEGGIPVIPGFEPPADAGDWLTTPLVDDIAAAAGIGVDELGSWGDRSLADVYQEGICAGALMHLNVGEAPREVLVPLAHQSAFAGAMLATQFIVAQVPELLAARAVLVEARFDVLTGLPQVLGRPRVRSPRCFCGDAVFRDVYGRRLDEQRSRAGHAAEAGSVEVS
jgi:ThiF family